MHEATAREHTAPAAPAASPPATPPPRTPVSELRVHTRVRHGLRRPHNWMQLVKFCAVGGSGYVVNLCVFAFCVGVLIHCGVLGNGAAPDVWTLADATPMIWRHFGVDPL